MGAWGYKMSEVRKFLRLGGLTVVSSRDEGSANVQLHGELVVDLLEFEFLLTLHLGDFVRALPDEIDDAAVGRLARDLLDGVKAIPPFVRRMIEGAVLEVVIDKSDDLAERGVEALDDFLEEVGIRLGFEPVSAEAP